jgi:O-antigen/teichoic acid export membrane protein
MHIRQFIIHTLRHAPWAVVASLCAGLSNYVIIILLSQYYGLTEGGQFRLLMSIVGLLTLFTLAEADKVAIRHLVMGKPGVIRPLLVSRMQFALLGTAAGLVTAWVFYGRGESIWLAIAAASLLLPFAYPTDLYAQIIQAKNNFRKLAAYSMVKYAILTSLAFISSLWSIAVLAFIVIYYVWLAAINSAYLMMQKEAYEPANAEARLYRRESIQLSFAGFFPLILEHADKLLVSYFLGLEKLALYTIGISTGRLISIVIKPTMTVYFPVLVKERFSLRLMVTLFVVLSAAGLIAAWPLYYYFAEVLGSEYAEAYPLAAIIIAGLGVYFISVVVYYSSVYYKDARLSVPTMTSVLSTLITLVYLVFVLTFGGDYALVLSAASYPLRDLLTLVVTVVLSRRARTA